jgi:hypothetical protein
VHVPYSPYLELPVPGVANNPAAPSSPRVALQLKYCRIGKAGRAAAHNTEATRIEDRILKCLSKGVLKNPRAEEGGGGGG